MTSTNERRGADPLLAAFPAEVERGIRREFLKHPETCSAAELAGIAMTAVGPVLDAKDTEITRLRRTLRSAGSVAENALRERLAVLEANVRASEQARCVAYLDRAGFTDAAGVLTNRANGRAAGAGKTTQ